MIELLKDIYGFFYKNIREISIITLVIELPYILIANIYNFTELNSSPSFWFVVILAGAVLVVQPFALGTQIVLYSNILNGVEFNLKECISKSWAHFPKLIVATFIYGMITFLGLIAFIIPGIIFASRCSMYGFLIVYEGYNPVSALKRSADLTNKMTWQIANPLFFILLIIGISQIIVDSFIKTIGLYNFFSVLLLDIVFSIISWMSLILVFRFYCLLQNKNDMM